MYKSNLSYRKWIHESENATSQYRFKACPPPCPPYPCPPTPYSCCCIGPPGPVGTILGSYNTLAELIAAHPMGSQGDTYLVAGELYVWDTDSGSWKNLGSLVGPQGPPGPTGTAGAIIPYSSGGSEVVSTAAGGFRSEVVMVGFGSNHKEIHTLDPIALDATSGATHLAFPIPHDAVVTELGIYINVAAAPVYDSTVVAELFASKAPNNSFDPIPGAKVELPISALAPIGSMLFGSVSLEAELPALSRVMLVFYLTSSDLATITMHMSGSVKIESPSPEQP